ncbi:sensor histidine kinase [Hyalangium minutum]|uniref:histidine kinase n=1 Tax=Hyalangium minutum TaxID=394096 RepID=A0A085WKV5_9BACT|nr:ATP-binding protein [Hyalangium minutum]KFE68318.1 Sensory box histidine kinase/response regulator [Hyalangium minutum]
MKPVRVMVVEDDPEDMELMGLELRRAGFSAELHRVETAEEMEQALRQNEWDAVISDYQLPLFSAPEALRLLQETGKDIPFIVVSGTVGEADGVELMRAGARDYFPKDRITRLAAAVTREVGEAEARRAKTRAELERSLLARVGEVLTAPLDFEQWLERLAQLPVPVVADWCAIFLEEGQGLRLAALAHPDPAQVAEAFAMDRRAPLRPDAPTGPTFVLRTGQPEFLPDVSGKEEQLARNEEHLRRLRGLGLRSVLHVPLCGRQGAAGVLMLATNHPRRLVQEDLGLAQELARRTSLVLENARLFREMQEAVHLRDDFLTVAAHELRTPLTTLRLQLGALTQRAEKEGIAPDFTERLERCQRQTRRLATLVEGLLDVTRLASGEMMLQPERFDLAELVAEVVERHAAEAQGARCEVRLEATPALWGRWDRLRVDQAVSSLMNNALKFGSGHPVQVVVTREGALARVEVRDRGIGIPPDQLERIFERFERAVSSRSYGGLGLGLYLARRAAEAHGGRVWAQARAGGGATFTLELPLDTAEVHP